MRATPLLLSSPAAIFYCTWADALYRLCGSPSGVPGVVILVAIYLYHASIATWIVTDAQRSGYRLPYDYGGLVFVFAIIFAPLYLFSKSGIYGVIPIITALLLIAAGVLSAEITAAAFQLVRQLIA